MDDPSPPLWVFFGFPIMILMMIIAFAIMYESPCCERPTEPHVVQYLPNSGDDEHDNDAVA